jgi:hypothetical protein
MVVLFPALFLIMVVPIAVFVMSGGGTHMTPILLEPFALPWSFFLNRDPEYYAAGKPGLDGLAYAQYMDHVWILVCCAINFVLVVIGSAYLDKRVRRTPSPPSSQRKNAE